MCCAGDKHLFMLSELALVDWVALLIAFILLGVAAVAAYLAHASSGAEGALATPPPPTAANYQPSHAGVGEPTQNSTPGRHLKSVGPMHAEETDRPKSLFLDRPVSTSDPVVPRIGRAQGPDEVIDLNSDREETVSDRAKRLRSRPVPETAPAQRANSLDRPASVSYTHLTLPTKA